MSESVTLYEYDGRDYMGINQSWTGESARLMYSPENGVELKALNWTDDYGDTIIDPIPLPDIEVVKLAQAFNKQVREIIEKLVGKPVIPNDAIKARTASTWQRHYVNSSEFDFEVGEASEIIAKHKNGKPELRFAIHSTAQEILECRALYLAQQAASE